MFGALTTFELREFGPSDSRKEIAFKVGKAEMNEESDLDEFDEC